MSILEQVFSQAALENAWLKVKQKGKAGGIDNVTLTEFMNDCRANLRQLQEDIFRGSYAPEPYKLFFIQKNEGEYRPLGLMTLRDKIAQHCVLAHYQPLFERTFVNTSYAYRKNKGHQKAIARAHDFIIRKRLWIASLDIDNFFDTIDRALLFETCRLFFPEPAILKLIEMWVLTGMIYHGKYVSRPTGIAQGGVLSPTLSNIYLHALDTELQARGIENVRYADNILLFSVREEEANEKMEIVREFLKSRLKLSLNDTARSVQPVEKGFVFLGIYFHAGEKRISEGKMKKMRADIDRVINDTPYEGISRKIKEIGEGIQRYYAPYDTLPQIRELEEHMWVHIQKKIKDSFIKKEFAGLKEIKLKMPFLPFFSPRPAEELRKTYSAVLGGTYAPEGAQEAAEPEKAPFEEAGKQARRNVNRKRAFYTKLYADSVDISVITPNTQIGKSGDRLVIRREGKIRNEVAVKKIKNVLIGAKGVTISSDAVKICAENDVRVNYYDGLGRPIAYISGSHGPAASVSLAQAEALSGNKAKYIARQLIFAKVKNQAATIKFCIKNRKLTSETRELFQKEIAAMDNFAETIRKLPDDLSLPELQGKIFGYEGNSAVSYWSLIKQLLPPDYEFAGREHQDAKDVTNNLLNYAYGILYSRVMNAITVAGLNPNISFLHSEQKDKPTFVFDLIEQFRAPVADRAVLALAAKKVKITKKDNLLSDESRNRIARNVLLRLNNESTYRGERITFNDIILDQAKSIVAYLKGETKVYRPFLAKW